MEDSLKKQELDPIRTLRLNPPNLNSPEKSNRERLRPNFNTDSGKLSYYNVEPVAKINPLSTVLNRAQHAKRESVLHGIGIDLNTSPAPSNKSISKKSSVAENDRPENYSPKKSVFGEYPKFQEQSDHTPQELTPRRSVSPLDRKESEHCFFGDNAEFEPNFFQSQVHERNPLLPKFNRQVSLGDRRKLKRSSIDFTNGIYCAMEDDTQILNNISKLSGFIELENAPQKKKKIKKRKSKSSQKKNNPKEIQEDLEKVSEESEEGPQGTILRKR